MRVRSLGHVVPGPAGLVRETVGVEEPHVVEPFRQHPGRPQAAHARTDHDGMPAERSWLRGAHGRVATKIASRGLPGAPYL